MNFLQRLLHRLGKTLSILGISDPDEVKRKRDLYEAQRAARQARENKAAQAKTEAGAK